MLSKITQSPTLVRVVPFLLFLRLTLLQERLSEPARHWIYFLKTIVGAAMLYWVRQYVAEVRWQFSGWAVLTGVGVFVMWVGLDPFYPRLDRIYPEYLCPALENLNLGMCHSGEEAARRPWNPFAEFELNSLLAVFFVIARILGSTLVVPPLEEMFYRSFVYRFVASKEFLSVPLSRFIPGPFIVTAVLFGFAHHEWLAGILCGLAYQGLVVCKGRLGDALTAHAITNFLLGLWVIWRGAWHFW
jgi:membrane protease YdiL (CAAX protease family)